MMSIPHIPQDLRHGHGVRGGRASNGAFVFLGAWLQSQARLSESHLIQKYRMLCRLRGSQTHDRCPGFTATRIRITSTRPNVSDHALSYDVPVHGGLVTCVDFVINRAIMELAQVRIQFNYFGICT